MAKSKVRYAMPLMSIAAIVAVVLIFPACSPGSVDVEGAGQPENVSEEAPGYPNTLTVGRLSVGYPDGFEAREVSEYEVETEGRTFTEKTSSLTTSEAPVSFAVAEYAGVTFDEAWEYAVSEPEKTKAAAEELARDFGTPKDLHENTVFEDPQRITLNGSEAIVCKAKNKSAYMVRYFISIDENVIGMVKTGYTEEQYAENSQVFDGVLSSIKVI